MPIRSATNPRRKIQLLRGQITFAFLPMAEGAIRELSSKSQCVGPESVESDLCNAQHWDPYWAPDNER